MSKFLLSPCRIGWLSILLGTIIYGFVTQEWLAVVAALAPAVGVLAGWLVTRRGDTLASCDLQSWPEERR